MEKSQSGLFHGAWKSRKQRGIPTFHTASTATGYSLLCGLTGSDPNRRKWLRFSPSLTAARERLTDRRVGWNRYEAALTLRTPATRQLMINKHMSIHKIINKCRFSLQRGILTVGMAQLLQPETGTT